MPLPLPRGRKAPPPTGFTGAGAATPDATRQAEWARRPDSNIAVRMPAGVLGIDVDDYAGKHGGQTIAALEARLGPLPSTYASTSRDDGASCIRFFRVPVDQAWKGGVSADHPDGSRTADVDLIHCDYRYAVVAPSLHPEGRQYVWRDAAGAVIDQPPAAVGDLPELPDAWVQVLSGLQAGAAERQARRPRRSDWVDRLSEECATS